MGEVLLESDLRFGVPSSCHRGKVRDAYFVGEDLLVMVVTDRISAFDVVLPWGIPSKGQVLNELAAWFLDGTRDILPNWKLGVPDPMVTVGYRCRPYPVEMVIRGYLSGHGWREYASGKRELCGVRLPDGLRENARLPEPIITPTTKASEGHDEDISGAEIVSRGLVSASEYARLEEYTRALYARGTEIAARMGLILVDTKYEFGVRNGEIMLIDEIHTPDSSRYFYSDSYADCMRRGESPRALSKEFVRAWLQSEGFTGASGQAVPSLSASRSAEISARYRELYESLLGRPFCPAASGDIGARLQGGVSLWLRENGYTDFAY